MNNKKHIIYKLICYYFLIFLSLICTSCNKEVTEKATQPQEIKHFKLTYEECRDEFYKSIVIAQEKIEKPIQTGSIQLKSTKDNDLTTDWCYIPPKSNTTNLFVMGFRNAWN